MRWTKAQPHGHCGSRISKAIEPDVAYSKWIGRHEARRAATGPARAPATWQRDRLEHRHRRRWARPRTRLSSASARTLSSKIGTCVSSRRHRRRHTRCRRGLAAIDDGRSKRSSAACGSVSSALSAGARGLLACGLADAPPDGCGTVDEAAPRLALAAQNTSDCTRRRAAGEAGGVPVAALET
jgi:hypothetical protein